VPWAALEFTMTPDRLQPLHIDDLLCWWWHEPRTFWVICCARADQPTATQTWGCIPEEARSLTNRAFMNNKSATARGISSFPPLFRLDDSPPNTLLVVRITGKTCPASRNHPASKIGVGIDLNSETEHSQDVLSFS